MKENWEQQEKKKTNEKKFLPIKSRSKARKGRNTSEIKQRNKTSETRRSKWKEQLKEEIKVLSEEVYKSSEEIKKEYITTERQTNGK